MLIIVVKNTIYAIKSVEPRVRNTKDILKQGMEVTIIVTQRMEVTRYLLRSYDYKLLFW